MGLNKLNNKGYMLVEIVLASALAFGIAYFILDMTIKLKNKNDDLLVETLTTTDQTIITNILMESIKENPNEFSCDKVDIDIENKIFSYNNNKVNIINEYASVDEKKCEVNDNLISVNIPINVKQLPDKNFDVNVVYYKNIVIVDNITVNGASKETLTFKDSSGNITSVTTDDSGKASVSLKVGEYMLTGSVSEYNKNVTVDISTTEINAYPDGTVYWYGNGDQSDESLFSVTGGFKKASIASIRPANQAVNQEYDLNISYNQNNVTFNLSKSTYYSSYIVINSSVIMNNQVATSDYSKWHIIGSGSGICNAYAATSLDYEYSYNGTIPINGTNSMAISPYLGFYCTSNVINYPASQSYTVSAIWRE